MNLQDGSDQLLGDLPLPRIDELLQGSGQKLDPLLEPHP